MGASLEKLIDINASGLVLMACNTHKIWDPEKIEKYKNWVILQITNQMEHDHVGVESLSRILDEKIALLHQKLESGNDDLLSEPQVQNTEVVQKKSYESNKLSNEPAKATPKGEPPKTYKCTDMPTKLAQERKPVSKLILEDCVQLGLISRNRAEYVVTQMSGKQPADAEKEVVIELRDNLHKQVRGLIRKDKGGPWSSPKAQEELRLEIVKTPTVRSVLFLTRDILREREEWLKRSHSSLTGRIFGSKMSLDK